jgi:hypothetical protein
MLTATPRQTRYDFRPHRTLVNLAAAAWVGALMITGYYVLHMLVTAA